MEKKKAPVIKKNNQVILDEYIEKNEKLVRGQILFFNMRGVREKELTWRSLRSDGQVFKKKVKHNDIIEIPFHYARYLNTHGIIKKKRNVPMKLEDRDGNHRHIEIDDNEQVHYFRVLDILPADEMAELEPSNLSTANYVD